MRRIQICTKMRRSGSEAAFRLSEHCGIQLHFLLIPDLSQCFCNGPKWHKAAHEIRTITDTVPAEVGHDSQENHDNPFADITSDQRQHN